LEVLRLSQTQLLQTGASQTNLSHNSSEEFNHTLKHTISALLIYETATITSSSQKIELASKRKAPSTT
jgi:hypothetical protein